MFPQINSVCEMCFDSYKWNCLKGLLALIKDPTRFLKLLISILGVEEYGYRSKIYTLNSLDDV